MFKPTDAPQTGSSRCGPRGFPLYELALCPITLQPLCHSYATRILLVCLICIGMNGNNRYVYIYMYMCLPVYICTNSCIYMHIITYIQIREIALHSCIQIQTYIYTQTCVYIHTYIHVQLHARVECIQLYIYICTHMFYWCDCIYIYICIFMSKHDQNVDSCTSKMQKHKQNLKRTWL